MKVHVVGAGLAGLAAAVRLAEAGLAVRVHEAAPQAGGRCRSYQDQALGRVIDNGNHLLLSGNASALRYLQTIGAADSLAGPASTSFPFLDLATGRRWVLRPNAGLLPVWLLQKDRRVPESRLLDYLKAWRLASAGPEATVADCLRDSGVLWERFWAPLATAVLNTPPDQASARLLWAALRESFAKGGEGCRPLVAAESLAASLVDPALRFLERHDAGIAFGRRLRGIDVGAGNRASQLRFAGETVDLGPKDQVILALPPERIGELLPRIEVPTGSHAIVNAHFKLPAPATLPEGSMLLGLVGGKAEWLFLRDGIASVTISAADRLIDEPAERLAADLWREVAAALELDGAVIPPNRIIKEKRATFAQTPEEVKRRPGAGTPWSNLRLAGDWTDTGLPATIEGAIRSGDRAAELVLAARSPG